MKTIGFVRAAQFHQKRRESLRVGAGDVVQLPDENAAEVKQLCPDACDLTPSTLSTAVTEAWAPKAVFS